MIWKRLFKRKNLKSTNKYPISYDEMVKHVQKITGWDEAESAGALCCIDSNMVVEKGKIENYYIDADNKEIIKNLKACGYL